LQNHGYNTLSKNRQFFSWIQILDYFSRELDIIIISAILGKDSVGLYSLCKKIVLSIYNSINPIITKVLTPIFATIQAEKDGLRRIYLDTIQTLAIVNYPLYSLVAIFSVGILNFIYGQEYVDGYIVLSFISLTYGLHSTGSPVGSLQVALGKTDTGFYWTIIRILLSITAVYIGVQVDLNFLSFVLFLVPLISNYIFWKITIEPLVNIKYFYYFKSTIITLIFVIIYSLPFYFFFRDYTSVPLCILIGFLYCVIYLLACNTLGFKNFYIIRLINNIIYSKLFNSKNKHEIE